MVDTRIGSLSILFLLWLSFVIFQPQWTVSVVEGWKFSRTEDATHSRCSMRSRRTLFRLSANLWTSCPKDLTVSVTIIIAAWSETLFRSRTAESLGVITLISPCSGRKRFASLRSGFNALALRIGEPSSSQLLDVAHCSVFNPCRFFLRSGSPSLQNLLLLHLLLLFLITKHCLFPS